MWTSPGQYKPKLYGFIHCQASSPFPAKDIDWETYSGEEHVIILSSFYPSGHSTSPFLFFPQSSEEWKTKGEVCH